MSQRYIVVFKNTATKDQIDNYEAKVNSSGGEVTRRFDTGMNGFAAMIPDSFLTKLQADSIIDFIEPDSIVTTQ
ncbi:hypothetical protein FRB96_008299 [Tulasnella sp. 330]|nr:hypothetical protein FRB96_008299 [Tulasnella sp. 330]